MDIRHHHRVLTLLLLAVPVTLVAQAGSGRHQGHGMGMGMGMGGPDTLPAEVTAATLYEHVLPTPQAVSVKVVAVPPVEMLAENGPPLTERL